MTSAQAFALFDTAIGRCGIVWTAGGVIGIQLPESTVEQTGARLRQQWPHAVDAPPPPEVQSAIDAITDLLAGHRPDLSTIPLDMTGVPPFFQRVYELARTIEPGTTLTYGEIAALLGAPGAARAVGSAMRRNPFAVVVPCHRVLAAGGRSGGFSAGGGVSTKLRLLRIEGARVGADQPDDQLAMDFAPRGRAVRE